MISVVLEIELGENTRRLLSPAQSDLQEMTRAEVLEAMRARYRLLQPSGIEVIELDVTELSADEAAGQIAILLERAQS